VEEIKKAAIKRIWEAQDTTHKLEVFWQDHFYSSGNKFGYPVCVQLVNTLTGKGEDITIIGHYRYPDTCAAVLQQVDEYLKELGATKAKP